MCIGSPDVRASVPAPITLPDQNSGDVRIAGDRLRRRRARAQGFASTILTTAETNSTAAPLASRVLLGA